MPSHVALTPAAMRAITRESIPPLCPELGMHAIPSGMGLDDFRTAHAEALGAAVPYWAIAWPGGQAIARFLLDHPETVSGRHVVDLGCGAGLVAAAAMRAGAAKALAVDSDPNALIAAAETGRRNGVTVATRLDRIELFTPEPDAIICAGDLWYEPWTARRATSALRRMADKGALVICGDSGRPGRPRRWITERARYAMMVSEEFESRARVTCIVFELAGRNILQAHEAHVSGAGAHRTH